MKVGWKKVVTFVVITFALTWGIGGILIARGLSFTGAPSRGSASAA